MNIVQWHLSLLKRRGMMDLHKLYDIGFNNILPDELF